MATLEQLRDERRQIYNTHQRYTSEGIEMGLSATGRALIDSIDQQIAQLESQQNSVTSSETLPIWGGPALIGEIDHGSGSTTAAQTNGGQNVATTSQSIENLKDATTGNFPGTQLPEVEGTQVENVSQEGTTLNVNDPRFQAQAPAPVQAATGEAAQVDPTATQVSTETGQMEATTVGQGADVEVAQGVAVERDLKQGELMSEQMAELTAGLASGEMPDWAKPAVAAVERNLASRGLSRSSIGEAALSNAIIQAAMPIAQANAAALQRRSEINLSNAQQMTLQNLNNEQQAAFQRSRQQQQVLLTDQAAQNAAAQFNATSEQQVEQFNAQLRTSIEQNNAARLTTVSQFNAGQINALEQFNAQVQAQVEQFNASNATAIAQSNVQWRRQANLADTAAQNQANLTDANNRFKLTQQDMANRWQSLRDLAHWSHQSAQNNFDRQNKLALGAIQAEAATDAAYQEALGMIIGYGLQGGNSQGVREARSLIGGFTEGAGNFLFGEDGVGGESGFIGNIPNYIQQGWDWVTSWF